MNTEPWYQKLADGDSVGAWDLFDARYRRLILATINRLVSDPDDRMDVFGSVCQQLFANDCSRLRSYSPDRAASVATWIVAVVRNLTVDWLRSRDGRRRTSVPADLVPIQRDIFQAICIEGASHVEAYEILRAGTGAGMSFPEFLRHVRETRRRAPCPDQGPARAPDRDLLPDDATVMPVNSAETGEAAAWLAKALEAHPADVRLAVRLFVVEGMTAADVARVVGWTGPKAVYNRVSRALLSMRADFERRGIGRHDL